MITAAVMGLAWADAISTATLATSASIGKRFSMVVSANAFVNSSLEIPAPAACSPMALSTPGASGDPEDRRHTTRMPEGPASTAS